MSNTNKTVENWMQTGLLDGLDEAAQAKTAQFLENQRRINEEYPTDARFLRTSIPIMWRVVNALELENSDYLGSTSTLHTGVKFNNFFPEQQEAVDDEKEGVKEVSEKLKNRLENLITLTGKSFKFQGFRLADDGEVLLVLQ